MNILFAIFSILFLFVVLTLTAATPAYTNQNQIE